jgi:hypothetical protein
MITVVITCTFFQCSEQKSVINKENDSLLVTTILGYDTKGKQYRLKCPLTEYRYCINGDTSAFAFVERQSDNKQSYSLYTIWNCDDNERKRVQLPYLDIIKLMGIIIKQNKTSELKSISINLELLGEGCIEINRRFLHHPPRLSDFREQIKECRMTHDINNLLKPYKRKITSFIIEDEIVAHSRDEFLKKNIAINSDVPDSLFSVWTLIANVDE